MNAKQEYAAKLQRPEWKLRRLEILERDEFTCRRCKQQSQSLHVHHTRYVAGKEPWEHPDEVLETLCGDCHEANHSNPDNPVLNIVAVIASAKSWPKRPPPPREFKPDRLWRFLGRFEHPQLRKGLMAFGGWLWKTGLHDMPAIEALILDRVRRNPDQPYAYYAPGGPGRECKAAQANAAINVAEHEEHKRADRAFGERLLELQRQAAENRG